MYVLKAKILLKNFYLQFINNVEINKSIETLSDTAILKIPRRIFVKNKAGEKVRIETELKAGDPVIIGLGYENNYFGVEFRGYITKILTKNGLEIECEDYIWKLRQKTINKTFEKTTLKEILQYIINFEPENKEEINTEEKTIDFKIKLSEKIPEITFDKYIIINKNGAQALQQLKEDTLLSAYIDDENNLYFGLIEGVNIGKKSIYDLNYNIISNDLERIDNTSKKILIKNTYIDPKTNKKNTVEVGEKGGEIRELTTSIISDEKILKKLAENTYKNFKGVGYSGTITTFLIPFATRGMTAEIIDTELKTDRMQYLIKSVKTTFGINGARRIVELGNELIKDLSKQEEKLTEDFNIIKNYLKNAKNERI
jgi:hypothetical protein